MREPVEPSRACRLLNHGPAVPVTRAHAGWRNVMAAAWSMAADFAPAKGGVIDRHAAARERVDASGVLALAAALRGRRTFFGQDEAFEVAPAPRRAA